MIVSNYFVVAPLWFLLTFSTSNEINQQKDVAAFSLQNGTDQVTYTYTGEDNLIFCYLYENNEAWIRIAKDRTNDGENSPHLDIDICGFNGTGTYEIMSPHDRPCGDGSKWDVWWHDDEKVFVNQRESTPCKLVLTVKGERIAGKFSCADLKEFKGEQMIQLLGGSFETKIIRK